jgi:hypothetical protein
MAADLPRDVWLTIVSKMDMDARIKCGLVFKLRVPQEVKTEISRVCQGPETCQLKSTVYLPHNGMPRYMLRLSDDMTFSVMNLNSEFEIEMFIFRANKWSGPLIKPYRN